MKTAAVIPVAPGRENNLIRCLLSLYEQTLRHDVVVVVEDGFVWHVPDVHVVSIDRHEPGREQPRNVGVRAALDIDPEITHVHFVDSDIILAETAVGALHDTVNDTGAGVVIAPYEWMPEGHRDPYPTLYNDPRWEMFHQRASEGAIRGDLSVGLGCFSGNLLWNVEEFERVGGYWAELYHGRCEDGELGARAVAMDVGIAMCPEARGWHLWHPVNIESVYERNARDVPLINERHPWIEGSDVFVADRDGKSFDVNCGYCNEVVPTNGWWAHAAQHHHTMELPKA